MLLIPLLLAIWINIHQSFSQCLPTCDFDQQCSSYDFRCYDVFLYSDYSSYTLTKGTTLGTASTVNGVDFNDILNYDNTTSITLSSTNSGEYYYLTVNFPSNYWLHWIDIDISVVASFIKIYVDGVEKELETSGKFVEVAPYQLPIVATSILFEFYYFIYPGSENYQLISVDIFGATGTPQPTTSPTLEPTVPTTSPTLDPTPSPTLSPTTAPSPHPTPDVCEEYFVHQSCCGHYDYMIIDDAINIRNNSLSSCLSSFSGGCCGDYNVDFNLLPPSRTVWGCSNNGDLNMFLCNASFYDSSTIIGEVIDGKLNSFPIDDQQIPLANMYNYCKCDYTVNECNGTDTAICGSIDDYNMLFDDDNNCWNNETWRELMDMDVDITAEECFMESNDGYYDYFEWNSCSEESFIGSVSHVINITSSVIHDGECGCLYYIKDCKLLPNNECLYRDEQEACSEILDTCCGDNSTDSGNVTPIFDINGYPMPNNWTCDNGNDVCPDKWNETRYYSSEYRVDWWYDGNTEEIERRCGCRYILDEVNYPPTYSPTGDPTSPPSGIPSSIPTKRPVIGEDDGEIASNIKLSFIIICGMWIINIFLL